MLRRPLASLLAVLSGDNESGLFYAAMNTQEHDPLEKGRGGERESCRSSGRKERQHETKWRDGGNQTGFRESLEEKRDEQKGRRRA